MIYTKSLSNQSLIYFIGRTLSMILSFAIPLILVRQFSKIQYGQYAQLIFIYILMVRMLRFGFVQSLFYFLPRSINNYKTYITTTFIFYSIIGFVNISILYFLKAPLSNIMSNTLIADNFIYLSMYIFFSLLSSPFESIYIIKKDAEKASLILFFSELLRTIFILSFVFYNPTVLSAIMALAMFSIIRFFFYIFYIKEYISFNNKKILSRTFKSQMKYSLPLGFSTVIGSISKRIDRIIISIFFLPEYFAIYSVSSTRIPLINIFFQSVGEVVLPQCVKCLKNKNYLGFIDLWKKLVIRLSFVGIAFFFIMQLIANDFIIIVFTSHYSDSIPLFKILLFMIFPSMLAYSTVLKSLNFTRDIFKSNMVSFICSIPITILLIKYYSMKGAAISAVMVYYINAIVQLYFSSKRIKQKFSKVYPIYNLFIMIFIACCIFIIFSFLYSVSGIYRIILYPILFILFYSILLKRLSILDISKIEIVSKILKKIKLKA